MSVQLSALWVPNSPSIPTNFLPNRRRFSVSALSSQSPTIQASFFPFSLAFLSFSDTLSPPDIASRALCYLLCVAISKIQAFIFFFVIYSVFLMQIIGVGGPSWRDNGYGNPNGNLFDGFQGESDHWSDLDTDLYHWTKTLRPVQVRYLFMCLSINMHSVLLH